MIYLRFDGMWIYAAGPLATDEYAFETIQEAQAMSQKTDFANYARQAATDLAAVAEKLETLEEIWNDRLYGVGLSNEITDADLAAVGIDANTLALMVSLAAQFGNFMHNQAVVQGDYSVTINQMRTDV